MELKELLENSRMSKSLKDFFLEVFDEMTIRQKEILQYYLEKDNNNI